MYSRSSGAAWSMAARRYFRKGEADLPKGGSWTYRGTQVVTGAEARKVAAEQAEERRRAAEALLRSRAPQPPSAAREAFSHDPKPASPRPAPPTAASDSAARPATSRSAPPPRTDPSASAESVDVGPSLLGRVRRALGLG